MKQRRMFLSDIASAMLRYKRYPSREDYISVACTVIKAYPFLKGTSGRPYVSFVVFFGSLVTVFVLLSLFFQDAIVQGLVNRFKEFRRDKSKPKRTNQSSSSTSGSVGKSPGITKQVTAPQLQVCIRLLSLGFYTHIASTFNSLERMMSAMRGI